ARAVAALEPAPQHAVLDIGFGGGTSFKALLRACLDGKVAGIDRADTMVTRARRIWARDIEAGRLQVEQGTVCALPWDDGTFDRVLTVNTIYFWEDQEAALREVVRVLAPGGLFASSVLPAASLAGWGYIDQ